MSRAASRDYTSDGLETLHYRAREIFAIIVTRGNGHKAPGNGIMAGTQLWCDN